MKLSNTYKAVLTGSVCVAVGATAGIVGSAAAPSTSKKQAAPTTSARPHLFRHFRGGHGGPMGGRFGRMGGRFGRMGGPPVHETSVVLNKKGDGFITVTEDSGTVKSVSGSDVTITEGFGKVTYKDATVTVPSGATIYRDGKKAAVGDLKAGDRIHVSTSSEGAFVMAFDKSFKGGPFGDGGPGRRHFGPRGTGGTPPAPPAPGAYGGDGTTPPAAS